MKKHQNDKMKVICGWLYKFFLICVYVNFLRGIEQIYYANNSPKSPGYTFRGNRRSLVNNGTPSGTGKQGIQLFVKTLATVTHDKPLTQSTSNDCKNISTRISFSLNKSCQRRQTLNVTCSVSHFCYKKY